MAPKRDLRESASTEEQDTGKRPRKTARNAVTDKEPLSAKTSRGDVEHTTRANSPSTADNDSTRTLSTPPSVEGQAGADVAAKAADKALDPVPPTAEGDNSNAAGLEQPVAQPALPPSDDLRGLFSLIDYVPDDVLQRLMPFVRKADDVNHRYALGCVPPSATWGTSPDTDSFLCVDNQPITIWAVGNTESPWFVTPDGQPHSRVNIGVRLPFKGDLEVVKKLFEKGRPKRLDIKDVVFAAKRMSTYGAKSGKTIVPFKAVFDATERFCAKSNMTTLPPGVLGKRDIVLVESYFTRWRTERDPENRRKWVKWNVNLELQAVNLLYEAPPDLVEKMAQEPEPVPDFDDDM